MLINFYDNVKEKLTFLIILKLFTVADSLDESGFLLFSAFIKRRTALKTRVHVFCFENFPCYILKNFNCEYKKYVVFHDCYTDPKGFFKENGK